MDIISGITGRRSIRKYLPDKIDPGVLGEVVQAAMYAPSWKNSQTAKYYIITDEAVKQRIADEACAGFAKNQNNINSAPALVVLSTVNGIAGYDPDGTPATPKGSHWQSFDAGIAAEAFCLAAYAHGLGSLIMGIYDEEAVAKIISLPSGESVSALIAVGKAAESPSAPKRKDISETVKFI